jgi:hypothetical protein
LPTRKKPLASPHASEKYTDFAGKTFLEDGLALSELQLETRRNVHVVAPEHEHAGQIPECATAKKSSGKG